MCNSVKVIVFYLYLSCCGYGMSVTKGMVTEPDMSQNLPYKWIEHEKMRAGYLYFNDPVSKIDLIKELKLNTVIVKCWRFDYIRSRQNTINLMREWAKAAKENNIHLFFAINWQPYARTKGIGYERVVYDDGAKGIAVCPFDERFWRERIQNVMLLVAKMSKETDLQVDGIFLDMEIYGSEKETKNRRNYFENMCDFSDLSFSQFVAYKGYSNPSKYLLIEERDRKNWLTNKGLLGDYYVFLRREVQNRSEVLRKSIREINPDLLVGMYPHPEKNNWVQYPLAKGFSTGGLPFIVFGVHSYGYNKDKNGDGYTRIPGDIKQQYKKDGINIVYSAGYLFSRYDGKTLGRNLKQTIKHWDGYWLFTLRQLWEKDSKEKLLDSVANFKEAIIISN